MREDDIQIRLVRYIYYPDIARHCQVCNAYLNVPELMVDKLWEGTEIREKQAYCLVIILLCISLCT